MPLDGPNTADLDVALTDDQARARTEILRSIDKGDMHLLTGNAGSGKTTLVQMLAAEIKAQKREIVLTAPTHKAVFVLSRKLKAAGLNIRCQTIQALLSLRPKPHGDRLVFERAKKAEPVTADVVVVDEASMVDESLLRHINRHLPMAAVLFVGDPAQLPPVGEAYSKAFAIKHKSHLNTIVRQGAGNPILDAADCLRAQQGGPADWSWVRKAMAQPFGVYLPGDRAEQWMRKAFTSAEFAKDADTFRYLCWTNKRVAEINARAQEWVYGGRLTTPFAVGERVLSRSVVLLDKDMPLIGNNDEGTVKSIEAADVAHELCASDGGEVEQWTARIPTWRIVLDLDGREVTLDMVAEDRLFAGALHRIKDEARIFVNRWGHYHAFMQRFARLQSIYAQTVHSSQGSTYRTAFIDMPEMRRWASADLLEAQRAAYVAVTRPSHSLVLVGA